MIEFDTRFTNQPLTTRETEGDSSALIVGGDLIDGFSNDNVVLANTPEQ